MDAVHRQDGHPDRGAHPLERHSTPRVATAYARWSSAYLNSFFESGRRARWTRPSLAHRAIPDVGAWTKTDEVPFDFEHGRDIRCWFERAGERLLSSSERA